MRFPTGDVVLKRPRTRFRDPHPDIPTKGSDEDWMDQLSGFAQGDSSQLLTAGTPHNYPSSQALVSYLTDWPTHSSILRLLCPPVTNEVQLSQSPGADRAAPYT